MNFGSGNGQDTIVNSLIPEESKTAAQKNLETAAKAFDNESSTVEAKSRKVLRNNMAEQGRQQRSVRTLRNRTNRNFEKKAVVFTEEPQLAMAEGIKEPTQQIQGLEARDINLSPKISQLTLSPGFKVGSRRMRLRKIVKQESEAEEIDKKVIVQASSNEVTLLGADSSDMPAAAVSES